MFSVEFTDTTADEGEDEVDGSSSVDGSEQDPFLLRPFATKRLSLSGLCVEYGESSQPHGTKPWCPCALVSGKFEVKIKVKQSNQTPGNKVLVTRLRGLH